MPSEWFHHHCLSVGNLEMKGDYALGAKLKPYRIEIEVDENLKLSHVGIGYNVQLPSGRLHESGFTWHSPKGDYAQAPTEHVTALQLVVDALLLAAAEHEGVELPSQGQSPSLEPQQPVSNPDSSQES